VVRPAIRIGVLRTALLIHALAVFRVVEPQPWFPRKSLENGALFVTEKLSTFSIIVCKFRLG
jgi:hypothetical protein